MRILIKKDLGCADRGRVVADISDSDEEKLAKHLMAEWNSYDDNNATLWNIDGARLCYGKDIPYVLHNLLKVHKQVFEINSNHGQDFFPFIGWREVVDELISYDWPDCVVSVEE